MIAVDSSSLIAFLEGHDGPDVALIERAIDARDLVFAPPVLTELRAGAIANDDLELLLSDPQVLPISDGFWERAGRARRLLIDKGLRARFADALIAQCCIDADVPLITRDQDYRHFERWCGLALAT